MHEEKISVSELTDMASKMKIAKKKKAKSGDVEMSAPKI
jgi:hypothetical protein